MMRHIDKGETSRDLLYPLHRAEVDDTYFQHFLDTDKVWLNSLAPHIDSYRSIFQRFTELQLANSAAWAALNLQKYGVQILDGGSKILFVNAALEAMVERSPTLLWKNGRLNSKADQLSNWLSHSMRKVDRPSAKNLPTSFSLVLEMERFHFMVAPISIENGFGVTQFVALFVSDMHANLLSSGRNFAHLYELTPRETDVALLLAQGQSAKAIADHMEVAISTVLTHKKSIFSKASIHTQSELVNLFLSLPIIDFR